MMVYCCLLNLFPYPFWPSPQAFPVYAHCVRNQNSPGKKNYAKPFSFNFSA